MIVAIHQPNYIPWLGYFDKILRSDVFVFLDHVEFSSGGSYTQRVHILAQGKPAWLTVPVRKKGRLNQAIRDTECDPELRWTQKHLRSLQHTYARHPFFAEVFPDVEEALSGHTSRLAEFNGGLVRRIAAKLGATCRFVESGTLVLPEVAKSELLAAIAQTVGGTMYLHGSGGESYQEPEVFARHGVSLLAQRFQHPVYPQRGVAEFIPGLSVVDALFNLGYEGTRALLVDPARSGAGESAPLA